MIHHLLETWIPEIAGVIELIGIIIILVGFVSCFAKYLNSKRTKSNFNMTICLGQSFAIGLQVMMGAEILKSVLVPSVSEMMLLLGIVVIRVALTLLLHYEIQAEEKHGNRDHHAH